MERLTVAGAVLAVLNLTAWFLGPAFIPSVDIAEPRSRLSLLEKDLPDLERTASWAARVAAALEPPSSASPNELLAELRTVAERSRFLVADSANDGGHPARLSLAGYGPYTAGALLANRLSSDRDLCVERISCETRDDGLIEFKLQILAGASPWEGRADPAERPELEPETAPISAIGRVDLFADEKPVVVERKNRPMLRYLGFFAETGTPTVILEENARAFLARVGEILPGGVKVLSADTDDIELYHHETGTWTVRMKTAP